MSSEAYLTNFRLKLNYCLQISFGVELAIARKNYAREKSFTISR